jgi:hypothetical protein
MADNNRPFVGFQAWAVSGDAQVTHDSSAGHSRRILVTVKMLLLLVFVGTCLDHPRTLAQAASPAQSTANSEAGIDRDVQLLRQDIRSQVKQLIAANLKLTDTEATKFWPVYDLYTADLAKINDQRYALIKEYSDEWGTMTDDQASSLARRYLALDEQVAQLRTKYLPVFNQAVPGTRVATFFQLDHRIQEMIDLQLASHLPLVQEQ